MQVKNTFMKIQKEKKIHFPSQKENLLILY